MFYLTETHSFLLKEDKDKKFYGGYNGLAKSLDALFLFLEPSMTLIIITVNWILKNINFSPNVVIFVTEVIEKSS